MYEPSATRNEPANPARRHPLSEIVRALKTFSARKIIELMGTPGVPVWQRNYYERIVGDEPELFMIREYISNNPRCWETDEENPDRA